MSRSLNILIFPGGTENGLEIKRSLEYCKEFRVFSASSDQPNHAPFAYKRHYFIPSINESGWLEALNDVIRRHNIDFVYPSNSTIISALNGVRDLLACDVVMAPSEAIMTTCSKTKTLDAVGDVVPVPHVFTDFSAINHWPVFVKPDEGYGAQGAEIIQDKVSLERALLSPKRMVVQEYLPGSEYTIDCLSSGSGSLLFSRARSRERIRMGTSMRSAICDGKMQEYFREVAEAINSRIPLTGAWFFQMKEDACGKLKLLEVDARVAGTMALNRVNGINFPALSIFGKSDKRLTIFPQLLTTEIDRCLLSRYKADIDYDCVYIDLDHTIILDEKVNTQIVQFLYQCINEGVILHLITKSLEKDLDAYLERHRIRQLFDEIHWLREDESKADYITEKSSIFIDDSYSQRVEVSERLGIPSLDPSMVELLIHERV